MAIARLMTAVATTAIAVSALGIIHAPHAVAEGNCGPDAGPPPKSASKDVSDIYGQPATLWLSRYVVGITTPQGYGSAKIVTASPMIPTAMLVDAQQDGNHQIIVDTGREAILYTLSGCSIKPTVDQQGDEFWFDVGHRHSRGDGVGCSDLGDGRRLVQLLQMRDDLDRPLLTVRRTEVELDGDSVTTGRSDTVTATSEQDPAWTTAAGISCGDLTVARDGVVAPG